MDWNYVLEIILKSIGSVAAAILIALGTALFTKLSKKIKDSKIKNYVTEAVKAAEQLYPNTGSKTGVEKYKYVVNMTLAKFPSLTNNDYLKSLIEGAVYTISEQTKQIAAQLSIKEENNTESSVISSF